MATPKETPYEAWEFTDEEYPVAVTFTELQIKHLKTELAIIATERVMMAVPKEGVEVYLREQEYMRGKMEQIAALLNTSEDALTALQQRIKESVSSQSNDVK